MERYTLNDLESLTGIKTDTIRIWERRYDILRPHRTPANRRWYTDEDLVRLINISLLYRNGIKISQIASMPDAMVIERVSSLSEGEKRSDDLVARMVVSMNLLDEAAINEMIMRSVIARGFEKTFTDVVFPFLHKVGVMWHTRSVNVGTEHFISGIFRQRLIAAIDSLPPVKIPGSKKFLLFLPEGELHELGLLFYTYLVMKQGHRALYLGQSTPIDAVVSIAEKWKPDVIITGLLSGLPMTKPAAYLKQLATALKGKKILAAGSLAGIADKLKLPGISALKSETELYSF